MTRRKTATWLVLAALTAGLCTGVFVNREKTRFRLAYGPGEVTVASDIAYVAGSANPKHLLDVYSPKNGHGAPVIIFVHGGSWIKGDKDYYALATGLYGSIGVALAKRGVVTVVQSYRLSPEVAVEGMIDDVMAALRWTQAHASEHGGDPRRVFMMGHSAGGHLVALAGADDSLHRSRGMDPRAVRGYVALSTVWDVAAMHDDYGPEMNAKVTIPVFGSRPEQWAERSPLNRLHAGAQPFLIVVGAHDYPHTMPQAERARDRLLELGAKPRYFVVPDRNHLGVVLSFGSADDKLTSVVVDFVNQPLADAALD